MSNTTAITAITKASGLNTNTINKLYEQAGVEQPQLVLCDNGKTKYVLPKFRITKKEVSYNLELFSRKRCDLEFIVYDIYPGCRVIYKEIPYRKEAGECLKEIGINPNLLDREPPSRW